MAPAQGHLVHPKHLEIQLRQFKKHEYRYQFETVIIQHNIFQIHHNMSFEQGAQLTVVWLNKVYDLKGKHPKSGSNKYLFNTSKILMGERNNG
jgi:hypothetical protein